jgi:group I intron endonuclease
MSSTKRKAPDSGMSVDKRPRISSDDSEILEFEESDALIEQVDGDDNKCRTGCIYLITNPFNGKVYVGQTLNYKRRMSGHEYSGKNPKFYFSRAIHKYGWENFTKEILIDDVPEEDLDNLEINYIAFYNSFNRENGYNRTKGGGGTSGFKCTEEQRQAQSKVMTKNHSVEGGGCVCFCNTYKKWKAIGSQTSGHKSIGKYFTKEHACQALNLYNETGECMPSDVTKRRAGTGSISFRKKKWRATSPEPNPLEIGGFFTKEKAIAALKLYNETGERMPSDITQRRDGTGSIRERPTKRMVMRYYGIISIKTKIYRTKTYGSRKEAELELEKIIINNQ